MEEISGNFYLAFPTTITLPSHVKKSIWWYCQLLGMSINSCLGTREMITKEVHRHSWSAVRQIWARTPLMILPPLVLPLIDAESLGITVNSDPISKALEISRYSSFCIFWSPRLMARDPFKEGLEESLPYKLCKSCRDHLNVYAASLLVGSGLDNCLKSGNWVRNCHFPLMKLMSASCSFMFALFKFCVLSNSLPTCLTPGVTMITIY